jgi:hypothetical protein
MAQVLTRIQSEHLCYLADEAPPHTRLTPQWAEGFGRWVWVLLALASLCFRI